MASLSLERYYKRNLSYDLSPSDSFDFFKHPIERVDLRARAAVVHTKVLSTLNKEQADCIEFLDPMTRVGETVSAHTH